MDHYPPIYISERETTSTASSPTKNQQDSSSKPSSSPQYNYTAAAAADSPDRVDSAHSTIAAEFAQYTDAPPPYSAQAYEGKSEEQQTRMRMADYAKEIQRMMGRQLVRGLKGGSGEREGKE